MADARKKPCQSKNQVPTQSVMQAHFTVIPFGAFGQINGSISSEYPFFTLFMRDLSRHCYIYVVSVINSSKARLGLNIKKLITCVKRGSNSALIISPDLDRVSQSPAAKIVAPVLIPS
jgi:hypothetical protein